MRVAEWIEAIEALRRLPQEAELPAIVPVTCAHCRDVGIATGWTEAGEAFVSGWRRHVGTSEAWACSPECADKLSRAAVLAGQPRPRWELTFE